MALNLKNPELERLASEVAELAGKRRPRRSAARFSNGGIVWRCAAPPGKGPTELRTSALWEPGFEALVDRIREPPAAGAGAPTPLLFVGDDFSRTDITPP